MLWSGESNAPRWISNPVETRSVATELEIAATRIEQNWLIVDAVRIYPGR